MKRILLLLLLLPNLLIAQRNTPFVVEIKNGFQYLNHIVKRGESLSDLSNAYSVKVQVLQNINHLNSNSVLKDNQLVMIPLIETNFYKMTGITSEQNGFYPLYYKVTQSDNLKSICDKFSVLPAAIKKWNHDNFDDEFQENEKIIIGWIKFKTNQSSNVESKPSIVSNSNKSNSSSVQQSAPKVENVTPPKQTNQRPTVNSSSRTSTTSTAPKEDSKVNQFFAKVKTSLKPKQESNKSESNSNSTVKTSTVKKANSNSDSASSKKSIKNVWNSLVNGKEKSKPAPVTKKAEPAATRPVATKPAPKNNVLYEKANQTKTSSATVAKTQIAPKPMTQYNSKPSTKEQSKPVEVKNIPKKPESVSNQSVQLATSTPKVSIPKREVKQEPIAKEIPVKEKVESIKQESKTEEIKVQKEIEPTNDVEAEPKISMPLHNEAKALDLKETKAGKCAYFFSGPTSGRFYVFTNLAVKGSIVKVTNTANNRFVMAEVIGNLPMSDVTKGLLIKLSDNAKLALSQKNNLFSVKVNY